MIRQSWWKILAVLLLVYTFVAGLLVPLKPGIAEVSPRAFKAGSEVEMTVTGYNSLYSKAKNDLNAWLKLSGENAEDERVLKASSIQVINDRTLKLAFKLPEYLPSDSKDDVCSLILDSPVDGAIVLPEGIALTQDSVNFQEGLDLWSVDKITHLNVNSGLTFPYRSVLYETIRNQYFHVPLWFAMLFLFLFSVGFSVRYLRTFDADADHRTLALNRAGFAFGILGLVTGALWAKYTWGAYWSWDVKQNMTAVALLIYAAYFILRGAFQDEEKKARLSAVYNIFAFAALIPLIFVIPRLTDSLHPGNGGNPAFGKEDLDNTMRMVFYPAGIGWTLLGFWIAAIAYRIEKLQSKLLDA
jgi:heme exporter protein C